MIRKRRWRFNRPKTRSSTNLKTRKGMSSHLSEQEHKQALFSTANTIRVPFLEGLIFWWSRIADGYWAIYYYILVSGSGTKVWKLNDLTISNLSTDKSTRQPANHPPKDHTVYTPEFELTKEKQHRRSFSLTRGSSETNRAEKRERQNTS